MKRPVHQCECGQHAWLHLTKGFVALIDPEFSGAAGLWNWNAHSDGRNWYATRSYHHLVGGERKVLTIRLHHMVLPAPYGFLVDHQNGNSLDNRRSNLRLATTSENATNKRLATTTSSRYRGVARSGNKWRAIIGIGGKQKNLGLFETELAAAEAYDAAAPLLHGAFARLNFPGEAA